MLLLPAGPDDLAFLSKMLAQAAFPAGGTHPAEVMADDHLRRYLDGWGRAGDHGMVAWEGDRPIGAAWTRVLPPERPGYGVVDDATPELSVAVVEGHRGRGVGRALVVGALDLAAAHGHPQVSLSVAMTNRVADSLYRRVGFVDVDADDGGSMTMVAPTAPAPPSGDATGTAPLAHLAAAHDGPGLARLRRVMIGDMGIADEGDWIAPFVAMWPEEHSAGRWLGALVTAPDDRPIASAMAVIYASPPGAGRPDGRVAHVGSVATEAGWRRRGAARAAVTAVLDDLDRRGVQSSMLNASADGADLYRSLGFVPARGQAMRRNATNSGG